MKKARETWPEGKENLSGPNDNVSPLLPIGLRRLNMAFNIAVNIISSTSPKK